MAKSGQTEVNELRVLLQETDSSNSRWTDAQLLSYVNDGRKQFAKESKAVKAYYTRTTSVGITSGNRWARYQLDPAVLLIDSMWWDDTEVELASPNEWDESTQGLPDVKGRPFLYRRVGDSIDLYFAPDAAKTLEVYASITTTDLTLTSTDTELSDDKVDVALKYSAFAALRDDGRDGTIYLSEFQAGAKFWNKAMNKRGPRYVEQTNDHTIIPWQI